MRNEAARLINGVSMSETEVGGGGGGRLVSGPSSLEKVDTALGNNHPWGGGRMWEITKERFKSPEGAKERMLRVKADLQGRKFRNLGCVMKWYFFISSVSFYFSFIAF